MKHNIMRIASAMAIVVCHGIAYAEDPAAADALFKRAVAALKTGDLSTACPSFAESHRLDPRPGTLVALADCEADAGRIATAVTLYDDFLRTVAGIDSEKERHKYLERVKKAQRRRDNIVKGIPELTLELPEGAPANVRMTRNGEPFTTTSLGLPIPVNPGEHVVTVQLASGQVSEQRIKIGVYEKQTIELKLPVVESKPVQPIAPRRVETSAIVPVAEPDSGQKTSVPGLSEQTFVKSQVMTSATPAANSLYDKALRIRIRNAGIVLGGVGVLGLATGIVTGSIIVHNKPFINENCPAYRCNAAGFEIASQLEGLNMANAVGLTVGGAALIAGGVMFGWGNNWFGLKQGHSNTQVGIIVAGPRDSFVGIKGAF